MLRCPRTCFHHRVEQHPDAQITPDTPTYLHSVRVAGSFPTSTTHILPNHQSRRIVTPEGMYDSMPRLRSRVRRMEGPTPFMKCFTKMTCQIIRGELVHLITVIDPTFTSGTSTFQVEIQHYDDGHDTQWFGQFNMLRWLPEKRSRRTD
ncbi:hypothetical protein K443DRAFT_542743 [Laccaria amethystina LaAM-08-1]|uniref:Uncharacterized protein n=1 Tax=Laccaria amethystina LaAM-08-1 TaxID=1095629 RepID=A0A0C9XWR4_9AGAR|nr:hypothetical protein K443DRAFT_542743 [Laccaria amethystina LaAM-08-1]